MNTNRIPEKCGNWTLRQEIGRGAYGVVYWAEGAAGEPVAVKVCRREDIGDEGYARELRGAKLFRLIPPQDGLVRMRELVETDWGFYTVLDLADNEFDDDLASPDSYRPKTLARVIAGEKALPLGACVKLALALAGGLAVLQRHHLLHRDIKPGNVLYVGGNPVLSDPGLLVEEGEASSLVGTKGYVPPEAFTAAASDIYSLGLTLKAASFGRQVDELDKGPAQEADTGASLFPVWWKILNKATNPDTTQRYRSAKAMLKDLQRLRRRMLLEAKTFVLPRYAWFIVVALVVAAAIVATRVKLDLGYPAAQRNAEDELRIQQLEEDSSYSRARWQAQDEMQKQQLEEAEATIKKISQDLDSLSLHIITEEENQ